MAKKAMFLQRTCFFVSVRRTVVRYKNTGRKTDYETNDHLWTDRSRERPRYRENAMGFAFAAKGNM